MILEMIMKADRFKMVIAFKSWSLKVFKVEIPPVQFNVPRQERLQHHFTYAIYFFSGKKLNIQWEK